MSKIKIICTLGPSSINKNFLSFSNKNIDLLRLNMSHLSINKLNKTIKFVKKNSKVPICIDTEGAQIRIKVKREKALKYGQIVKLSDQIGDTKLYPEYIMKKLKVGDILNVGFSNLSLKIIIKKLWK